MMGTNLWRGNRIRHHGSPLSMMNKKGFFNNWMKKVNFSPQKEFDFVNKFPNFLFSILLRNIFIKFSTN